MPFGANKVGDKPTRSPGHGVRLRAVAGRRVLGPPNTLRSKATHRLQAAPGAHLSEAMNRQRDWSELKLAENSFAMLLATGRGQTPRGFGGIVPESVRAEIFE